MTNKDYYEQVIKTDPRFGSPEKQDSLDLLVPTVKVAALALVKLAQNAGMDLRITETVRSKERQLELFNKRKTKLRNVGCHYFGIAFDTAYYINGIYQDKGSAYSFMPDMCKQVGLISGYDWGHGTAQIPGRFYDPDHVQLIHVMEQKALFTEDWYPPDDYRAYDILGIEDHGEDVWDAWPGVPFV